MSDPTPPAGSPDAPAIAVDGQQQKKPQSQMTKAERRAMQEAQRAAKAAKKEAEAKDQPAKAPKPKPQASGSQSPPPKPKPQAPQAPQAPPPDAQQPREKPAASKGGGGGGGGEAPESSKREKTPKKPKFDPADLHPAILRLGVQYQNREIIGGNARCVAMLAAFKHLIQDYKPATKDTSGTPSSVGRNDLVLHFKKPIEYLISCRRLSISMGNAIAGLKHKINAISDAKEDITLDALKKEVCQYIDMFIFERIVDADRYITMHGVSRIVDGDAILTFGRSSAVEMILRNAKEEGKKFSVFVVDSNPLFEGRPFAHRLATQGIDCTYVLLSAISNIIREVTKVFIGAAAVLTNGSVYSRIGTASVCLIAHSFHKPVLCCCETYKFTDKAWFNSLTSNEEGDPNQLIMADDEDCVSDLKDWKSNDSLSIVNMQYDLTPPEYISMLISEVGMIPPTSVPVIIREYHLKVGDS